MEVLVDALANSCLINVPNLKLYFLLFIHMSFQSLFDKQAIQLLKLKIFIIFMLFQESLGEQILKLNTDEIVTRTKLLENEIKVLNYISSSPLKCLLSFVNFIMLIDTNMFQQEQLFKCQCYMWILTVILLPYQIMKSEILRINHDLTATKEKIKENTEKIKVNKTLPYLVSNVIEVSITEWFMVSQKQHTMFIKK